MNKILIFIFVVGVFVCCASASAINETYNSPANDSNINIIPQVGSVVNDAGRAYESAMTAFEPFKAQPKNI